MNPIRIVIMAKAPLPGFAKTRLIPTLGPEGAAILAQRFLVHTITQVVESNIGVVELCVTPSVEHPIWRSLVLPCVTWSEQGDGDLGQRLARVSKRVTAMNEHLLLLGTDCPELTASKLREAAQALQTHDTCMIPAADGGYALLGVKKHSPQLFNDMPWSTADVAALTQARIKNLGYSFKKLATLNDVDVSADLQALPLAYLSLWQDLG